MIGFEDSAYTYEYNSYYKIFPSIHNWSTDPSRIRGGKKFLIILYIRQILIQIG
ncbi:MAG: hypothetical protein CM15mP106_0640 [Candidatus Neomarinimicrobiota bacterium]|nr:MAG: hypothetical protein CM15mP106_0640 [Candidatus Neomarinimicrobiota bacterium]